MYAILDTISGPADQILTACCELIIYMHVLAQVASPVEKNHASIDHVPYMFRQLPRRYVGSQLNDLQLAEVALDGMPN